MSTNVDRILAAREGAAVERVHTAPHHGSYPNGQHSFNIIMMLFILHPNPTVKLLRAAATHDLAERWSGDVPGSILAIDEALRREVKRVEEDYSRRWGFHVPDLDKDEEAWLKSLDRLELWLWCIDQLALGNQHTLAIEEDCRAWLQSSPCVPPVLRAIVEEIAAGGWRRLRYDDVPELGAPGKPNYAPDCLLCGQAGKKSHIGPCMTVKSQFAAYTPVTPETPLPKRVLEGELTPDPPTELPPHMENVTWCGCRECQWQREQVAKQNSTSGR